MKRLGIQFLFFFVIASLSMVIILFWGKTFCSFHMSVDFLIITVCSQKDRSIF